LIEGVVSRACRGRLVVAKAGAGDEMFRKDTFGERLLRCLVQRAYEEAKRDRDFATVIGTPVQQVLLERTAALLSGQAELPDAIVSRLVAALDMRRAESGGLERETIIKIARRLRPDEILDFDQAVVELERAVDVALDVIARGERGTNYDAFVDLVLAKVAEKTRLGDFDGGAQAVDVGLIDLDRREAEQCEVFRRSRVALLEAGVNQDILRRDPVGAAQRIETIVAVEQPDRLAWSPAFRERYDHFYEEGQTKGSTSFCRSQSNWRDEWSPQREAPTSAGWPVSFWATRFRRSGSGRAGRRVLKKRSRPCARRWKNGRAIGCCSTGL
jgi:hypothetical protein